VIGCRSMDHAHEAMRVESLLRIAPDSEDSDKREATMKDVGVVLVKVVGRMT